MDILSTDSIVSLCRVLRADKLATSWPASDRSPRVWDCDEIQWAGKPFASKDAADWVGDASEAVNAQLPDPVGSTDGHDAS